MLKHSGSSRANCEQGVRRGLRTSGSAVNWKATASQAIGQATVTAHTGGYSSRTQGAVDLPSRQVVCVHARMLYSGATVFSYNL